ncbi:MAG: hypothetical protein NT180_00280 [Actinobacteria bacterium]|nr:hypothetical protein [Actinomycetota bacterium]
MSAHDDHGNTPAAWTVLVIVTAAFIIGTVGLLVGSWVTFWVSVGVLVLGGIVGKVMQAMGLGKAKATSAS